MKELIAFILLGGVFFVVVLLLLICYTQIDLTDQNLEDDKERLKYRHWDDD
jgi:major membrane immunogen (membrane-anchored lipoprotein)